MGTLYECLKEAKLERYYPSFRSHGINRSEALTRLTVNDCPAFGINSPEDKKRLLELISIVKAVHNTERDNVLSEAGSVGRNSYNSKGKSARKRNRSPAPSQLEIGGRALAATSDVRVREKAASNISGYHVFGIGAAVLTRTSDEDSSDNSGSDSEEQSDYEPAEKHSVTASAARPFPGQIQRKIAVEKVKHGAGYNYGVPGGGGGARPKSRPGSARKPGLLHEDRIKVCVRKRPLSKREARAGEEDMIRAASTTTLVVSEPKQAVDLTAYTLQHEFIFDEVFEEKCTNEDVYIRAARPLISCVFEGGSATCFAYGQTGAGKTHTMIGNAEVPGLYLLAAHDMFSIINSGQSGDNLKVWVSFFEIYCGQLFDLLNKRNRLHAREDGSHRVCIAGLTETEATDEQTLMQVLDYGNSVRSKGVSGVNPDSSRSHAVLQMEVRDASDRRLGRISFIDLAGSERASDSGDPDKQTRLEGAEINQSLLALKECIRSIDQESRHKPFRQSKLTHILKDSFIGSNSKTCMIANIAPGSASCEHTLNTLRYADRVKELRKNANSSAASRSSSNVAMSNILMNIPAASGPSIFQPSNILCSSTPMRQSTRHVSRNSSADLLLDPSETPIRGPGAKRKTASSASTSKSTSSPLIGRRSAWSSNSESRDVDSNRGSANVNVGANVGGSSAKQGNNKTSNVTRHFAPNVASNAAKKQNFSSNSESDQTDTDSCNVTGPQRLGTANNLIKPSNNQSKPADNKAVSASQNIAVFRSSDTDNDFPTTDFNNVDEMNDLNRTDGKSGVAASTPVFPPRGPTNPEPVMRLKLETDGAQQGGMNKPMSVSASVPVLRKKIYTEDSSNSAGSEVQTDIENPKPPVTKPVSMDKQANSNYSMNSFKGPSSNSSNSGGVKAHENSVKLREPEKPSPIFRFTTSEDFEDDLLFDTPSMERKNITPRPSEGSGVQPRVRQDSLLQTEIPAVLPAKSTELASFSQSPRYNMNKNHHNNIQSPQYAQTGFRPNPVKTIPKDGGRNKREGYGYTTQGDRRGMETSDKSHLVPKSRPQDVSSNRDGEFLPEKGRTSSGDNSKEPISENWFTTPADLDTHLAKSVSEGLLQSVEIDSDETSLKKSDVFGGRGSNRNRSVHSDSGIAPSDSSASDSKQMLSKVDKDKSNYQNSDYSRQGYFSDSVKRNNAFSSRPRVVHSPKTVQGQGGSPVIKDYVSHSPVHTDSSHSTLVSEEREYSGALSGERGAQGSMKTGFSPIHPQPLTSKQTKPTVLNKDIVHPTPVGKPADEREQGIVRQNSAGSSIDLKSQLISSHEDQLATVTSLCKQEMKLLLGAKAGNKSFNDYMDKVSDVLSQKLAAIQLLQDQIIAYQLSTQDV